MRCKICGAKLRKEGDICKSCYEEYCKEEALEKDTKEILKLGRKYLPKYQLTRYGDCYIILVIILIALISQKQILLTILCLLFSLIALIVALFLAKKRAVNTACTFYEKKIVFQSKAKKKTMAYSDLKDITYYQNFFQKIFHLGDIQFHPESGTYLLGGFEIKDVPDIEENWEKIQEIIQTKKEV